MISKFLIFPAMADEGILQKSHRDLKVECGGGGDDSIQWDWWRHYSVWRTFLFLIIWDESLNSSGSFPEKSVKSRGTKSLTLKQTTGMQLHLISCSMLFRSQGLFRCTNWAGVRNGHESKPSLFPLHLMRASCRNAGSHPHLFSHGLFQDDKDETISSLNHFPSLVAKTWIPYTS